ncbi:MAG: Do family serine endopeptidase [Synergistaceae bacterium]|jgi:serine protease Do|nr:Do family serine endopeptidase [Synergistaceae bacterium]
MRRSGKILLCAVLLLMVALSLSFTDIGQTISAVSGIAATESSRGTDRDVYSSNPVARIAKECSPAVVNIDTETLVTRNLNPFANDPFFREFFGQEFERFNRTVPMRGKGSGFIVDNEGYIMTNNHVVEGADKITVTLLDGRHFEANLIGKDPTFDLAVIQIKAETEKLPVLPLGDSDAAEVGEWVVAIGNPLGFENTVTAGVISGKNRTLQAADVNFQGFMQTDAAINPGNSGGPLINLRGDVIAINTAIVPYAQGIGFAVPVNMAKQVMEDLIKFGEVNRGWLGVSLQTLTPGFAETYGIPTDEGAIISGVLQGSPAEGAGLRRGDVITAIDGKAMKSGQDVVFSIRNRLMGDMVSIEVYRDGRRQNLNVELGEIPGSEVSREDSNRGQRDRRESGRSAFIGATVSEITSELERRYNLKSNDGLVVISVERGSIANELGLRQGDQIIEVNRRKIRGIGDWERIVGRDPNTVVVLVQRGDQTLYFSYKK